jgi:hypothetical protein
MSTCVSFFLPLPGLLDTFRRSSYYPDASRPRISNCWSRRIITPS